MDKEVVITEVVPDRFLAFAPTSRLMRFFLRQMSFAFLHEPNGFVLEARITMRGNGLLARRMSRRDFSADEQPVAEEGRNLKTILEERHG